MNTMQDYEIRCTEEQTRRAYNLDAPLEITLGGKGSIWCRKRDEHTYAYCLPPTTQQMLGWLREKGFLFYFCESRDKTEMSVMYKFRGTERFVYADTVRDGRAELVAVDAALNYLEENR